MSEQEEWLDGYYAPVMNNWREWQERWSMGPCAGNDWVWFKGDYYTEEQARNILKQKPWGTREQEIGDE